MKGSEADTPPPKTTVSIPFKWEEAPGKPRHCHTQSEPGNIMKTLELPPRLLFLHGHVDGPSPTTVLDGPYVGRAVSFTTSYRTPRQHWNSNFGSTRWTTSKKSNKEDYEGIFDFSPHSTSSNPKVKITKLHKRGPSFFTPSKPRSHLLASIYESFKQVVPWRRKQQTQKTNWTSKIDTI